jgi:multicomponent Na+:H+ antiporter subunit G
VSVHDVVASFFVLAGGAFIAISALGLVRLPDVYLRMHSVAKAGTLGCGLILTGTAIGLPNAGVFLRVLGAIVFLLVTAPIASHLIGRAAHQNGAKMWEGTVLDEWDDAQSDRPDRG